MIGMQQKDKEKKYILKVLRKPQVKMHIYIKIHKNQHSVIQLDFHSCWIRGKNNKTSSYKLSFTLYSIIEISELWHTNHGF